MLAHAHALLAVLRHPVIAPVHVVAVDDVNEVRLLLQQAGGPDEAAPPGRFLSETERDFYNALVSGPMQGRRLIRTAGYSYGSSTRAVLANLINRGVLVRANGQGYRRAPLPEGGAQ